MSRYLACLAVLAFAFGPMPLAKRVFARQNQGKAAKPPAVAIDINKASVNDLQKLPGIGPGLGKQIVAYREKNGPFKRVEDLMVIKGIGFKKWKEIRPYVRVGDR